MYDLVLTNGLVVDGSRGKPYTANVCIREGKIARITRDRVEALETVDVAGLAVTPGFIDTHTHSDTSHLRPYPVESQVAQGVTTELAGNCGTSVMPATAQRKEDLDAHMRRRKGSDCFLSVSDYAAAGNEMGACLNYGTLIGHSTLRLAVMGFVNRDPEPEEMEQLKALLEQELQRGAFGMSLGLIYPPSAFCKTWELVELAKVVARYDGILAVHMRNEGPRLFEAVEEMLGIARASGVHVHISHLKLMGKPQWGKHPRLLKMLTDARAEGLNITCDQYPFPASSTSLSALVPHWAHEGGAEELVRRLEAREGDICQGIAREMENRGGPGAILVANTYGSNTQWQGKYISQLMEELGLDAVETVRHVLIHCGGRAFCVYFSMSREDMLAIMGQLFICVGSDGESLSHDRENTPYVPHPRYFSAFSRFYQTVREEKLMPLEDAVYKTTALPAGVLGLRTKGLLKEGMDADIAVFDPERFASRSDFLESRARPVGMQHVLVAGKFVIRDGVSTGAKPGRVILKKA
jgi:N-acyl-D-amino-acid deacylase